MTRLHEIERQLAQQGYTLERIRGSHRHYLYAQTHRRLTVTAHGGRHCRFTWRRLAEIRQDLERLAREGVPPGEST
jgi:predicted RNA binding protein YcfA (HicA-like mRNA interferase family)